mmetsp:Transcript_9566/g.23981  ORF Transcript_9566/g.23981 Transcript_9566/m.23981 type:complete len:296 (-) Transcript_9566:17-904(-)
MSTTRAFSWPERNMAPRMLLVAPLANVNTGNSEARSAGVRVPSLRVRKSGQESPQLCSESRKADTVWRASGRSEALRMAAFSRSSKPRCATWCERVIDTGAPSSSKYARSKAATRVSWSERTGANTEQTTSSCTCAASIDTATRRTSAGSTSASGLPSKSHPPRIKLTGPRTTSARSDGKSANGGSACVASLHTRTTPTRASCRRCTTALIKCVVPSISAPTSVLLSVASSACEAFASARAACTAPTMPVVTSTVVGCFAEPRTRVAHITTASVLVPPTSTPTRIPCACAALIVF